MSVLNLLKHGGNIWRARERASIFFGNSGNAVNFDWISLIHSSLVKWFR